MKKRKKKKRVVNKKCDHCEKMFTDNHKRWSHSITHSDEKAFKCDICQEYFKCPNHLKRHMEIKHKVFVRKVNANDLRQVVEIIKKLKAEPSEMKFINIGPVEDGKIVGHGDVGYGSLLDKVCFYASLEKRG